MSKSCLRNRGSGVRNAATTALRRFTCTQGYEVFQTVAERIGRQEASALLEATDQGSGKRLQPIKASAGDRQSEGEDRPPGRGHAAIRPA
jgi:hypothetical protein